MIYKEFVTFLSLSCDVWSTFPLPRSKSPRPKFNMSSYFWCLIWHSLSRFYFRVSEILNFSLISSRRILNPKKSSKILEIIDLKFELFLIISESKLVVSDSILIGMVPFKCYYSLIHGTYNSKLFFRMSKRMTNQFLQCQILQQIIRQQIKKSPKTKTRFLNPPLRWLNRLSLHDIFSIFLNSKLYFSLKKSNFKIFRLWNDLF